MTFDKSQFNGTIVERYGEFDYDYGVNTGYYIGKDKSPIIMNTGTNMYYWIRFDENDIATEVFVTASPGG